MAVEGDPGSPRVGCGLHGLFVAAAPPLGQRLAVPRLKISGINVAVKLCPEVAWVSLFPNCLICKVEESLGHL